MINGIRNIDVYIGPAIAGGIVNKRTKNELENTAVVVSKLSSSEIQTSEVANARVIQMEMLSAEANSDETKLVEIKDSKVRTHVNNLRD